MVRRPRFPWSGVRPAIARSLAPAIFLALAALGSFLLPARAAELSYYLPTDTRYDPAIPTPETTLGYEIGDWHVRHDQLVDYLEVLAKASDRVHIEEIGKTFEERPLLLLTISSPENLARIERIRERHLELSDPRSNSRPEPDDPVVVYLGYSIHGNESSGSNAALVVAYHLAAAQGALVDSLLSHAVILLDPCFNPDGFSRFSEWADMHRGKILVGDPNHREHDEAWPSGRTNHYWFDLNRDWLLLQQPESRARIRKYHEWEPNVLADFHEMGPNSTYFFQPGVPSRKNPLTPTENVALTEAVAAYHVRAMDKLGLLYYSQEEFDDFYYGKGSTYPDVNGAVGILFEQASSRGHLRESVNGDIDFAFTIRNQVVTSISTLEGALANRQGLLRYQKEFFVTGLKEAESDPVAGYVFGDPDDAVRNFQMLEILRGHRIEVYRLARPLDRDGRHFDPAAGYVLPLRQRQYRLARSLMETRTEFPDSVFYDVSAWTLPLAMGVPWVELTKVPADLLGAAVDTLVFPAATPVAEEAPYAYAFDWTGYYAPRSLGRLLSQGVRARVATRPFQAQTRRGLRQFGRGSIVVPMGIQEVPAETVRTAMNGIARDDGVEVYQVQSGWTPTGIDLGSPNLRALEAVRPLLVVGNGVSVSEAGEIWHLLDRRFGLEVSLVEARELGRINLDKYTHVIMVDGTYGSISEAATQKIKGWINSGGILIATKSATRWVGANQILPLTFKSLVPGETPTVPERAVSVPLTGSPPIAGSIALPVGPIPPPKPATQRLAYGDSETIREAKHITGAIFETRIDVTHPLGFGYRDPALAVFRDSQIALEPSANPFATVVQYTESPLLGGYVSEENLEMLKGSAGVIADRVGRGAVIVMVDDPDFRAYWLATNRLFLNAIFFGQIIETTGG